MTGTVPKLGVNAETLHPLPPSTKQKHTATDDSTPFEYSFEKGNCHLPTSWFPSTRKILSLFSWRSCEGTVPDMTRQPDTAKSVNAEQTIVIGTTWMSTLHPAPPRNHRHKNTVRKRQLGTLNVLWKDKVWPTQRQNAVTAHSRTGQKYHRRYYCHWNIDHIALTSQY